MSVKKYLFPTSTEKALASIDKKKSKSMSTKNGRCWPIIAPTNVSKKNLNHH